MTVAFIFILVLQDVTVPLDSFGGKAAEGALIWSPGGSGAAIASDKIPRDWTPFARIEFRIHNPSPSEKRFDLRLEGAPPAKFWRRISIIGEGPRDVVVELYKFRREKGPLWTDVRRLALETRQGGTFRIERVRLVRGEHGQMEPDQALIARAFPKKQPHVFRNARFRVISEVPIQGDVLLARLDEMRRKFDELFPSRVDPGTATLVIFRDRGDFQRFCERTAEELFGADVGRVDGVGYHVQDCAVSYWSDEWKELRPVYFHEVSHILISRGLGLDVTQKWFQEGLATLFQVECMDAAEQAKVTRAIRGMEQRERVGLKYVDASLAPSAAEYVQYLALVRFLFQKLGVHATIEAVRGGASLKEMVKDLDAFEQEWLKFCREYR